MSDLPAHDPSQDRARHAEIKARFFALLDLDAAARPAALAELAAVDPALAAEVASLLAHTSEAPIFASELDLEGPTAPAPTEQARPASARPESAQPGPARPGPVRVTPAVPAAHRAAPAPPPEPPRNVTWDEGAVADPLGLVGAQLDGRFQVEAFVAAGGFGLVYRATHLRWARPVAVKVFHSPPHPGDEAELVAAFLREGAVQNDLARQCLSVVQTYDVGTWIAPDGAARLYTVLEWLQGRTLASHRRRHPEPWPLAEVLRILGPIAEALEAAHRSGVAHRDVKPANLFVLGPGPDGRAPHPTAKLLDFGVAKVAAERGGGFLSTGGESTAFTVGYAAPEQLARAHGTTGPWTDVYALALVATELLSGRHPYGGAQPLRAMAAALDPERRPTPATLGASVSAAVEAVFAQALAVDAGHRPATAGHFWRALCAAAGQPPPLALAEPGPTPLPPTEDRAQGAPPPTASARSAPPGAPPSSADTAPTDAHDVPASLDTEPVGRARRPAVADHRPRFIAAAFAALAILALWWLAAR